MSESGRLRDSLRRFVARVRPGRASGAGPAGLAAIYERAALEAASRNPVIFIPGVMGSKLVDPEGDQAVWGDFRGPFANPDRARDAGLIALPMRMGEPLDRLHGAAEPDGSLSRMKLKLAGANLDLDVYSDAMAAMGVGSFRGSYGSGPRRPAYSEDSMASSFEFAYDWRRSLDEIAAELKEFIGLATRFIQAQRNSADPVRFDVVAHSMGGLVLRYFLRYGGQLLPHDGSLPKLDGSGAALVDRAILVATPSAGSLNALDRLVAGLPGTPAYPTYDPILIGTMPSLYQLLPRSRHLPVHCDGDAKPDLLDPDFWRLMQWGLADPKGERSLALVLDGVASASERRDVAQEHLEKCLLNARCFHEALDRPADGGERCKLHLIAGDSFETPAAVSASAGERRVRVVRHDSGDGIVLRSSALLDERLGADWQPRLRSPLRWDSVMFLPASHMRITRDPIFIDNALYLLLEQP